MTFRPDTRVQMIPVDQLRPHDRNPRAISRERFEALQQTLLAEPELLEARPLIALPTGMVVAGNMRQRALEQLYEDSDTAFLQRWPGGKVPVLVRDLDDEQARRWMLLDNNPFGEWEDQALAELIYEHEQAGGNLAVLGFTPERLTQLLDSVDGRRGANRWPDDPAPEPPDVGRSKVGQVYKLGRHRLMCGDATNAKHVERLLAGVEPRLMVTDPPYGIGLDLGWRDDDATERARANGKASSGRRTAKAGDGTYGGKKGPGGRPGRTGKGRTSMVNDDRADWSQAFELVPSLDVAYVWFADIWVAEVVAGIRRIGLELSQIIVWDKMAWALSRAHYHWRHELAAYAVRANVETEVPWYGPIADLALYARKPGSKVPFLGARDQPTVWSAPSPKRQHKERDAGDEQADHPTQKPTLLYTRPMQNHTLRGEPIYEPFSGSGTAIIASEMTGRTCYAMELDPRYVDVARERFKLFTEEGTTA